VPRRNAIFYLDGLIFAMAGESLPHGIISVNLVVALGSQLKGKPCQALTKDTKVRSGPTPMSPRSTSGVFSYPDIVVVCEEPEFHDAHMDIILNPTVIVEVLSSSTEAFDRVEKFSRYKTWNAQGLSSRVASRAANRTL
jgi:Uma2 family endonuclease